MRRFSSDKILLGKSLKTWWLLAVSEKLCEPYAFLLRRLLDVAIERFGSELVSFVVYGSVARCEAGRESDIDI
ncbi:MAG: nucleotidyltransferase domain-containing protein, partial [Sulfolobales archaeon]